MSPGVGCDSTAQGDKVMSKECIRTVRETGRVRRRGGGGQSDKNPDTIKQASSVAVFAVSTLLKQLTVVNWDNKKGNLFRIDYNGIFLDESRLGECV